MNRQEYLNIKNRLNLTKNPYFLAIFFGQTALLLFGCGLLLRNFQTSPVRFFAIPLLSVVMFRSFSFMHEGVHGLLSKSKRLNYFLGVVSGSACLLSYESWKESHIEHHRWSGNLDKDPVMAMIKTFPTFPKPLQSILTFGWRLWLPALSLLQHTVFWSITLKYTHKNLKSFRHIFSVIFPAIFWTLLFSTLPKGITLPVLTPAILLYLIGTEIINAPHHLGLSYFRGETKIPLWEQFKTARSCTYPTWLRRFVVLNFNFHIEHHMYPHVPWYHLDKLQPLVQADLKEQYNLDPKFSWVLKNRKRDLGTVFGSAQAVSLEKEKAA